MFKVILLSDLWGFRGKSNLEKLYHSELSGSTEFKYYDSSDLAGIPRYIMNEEEIHQRFINGGIQHAVKELQKLEQDVDAIIGLSIGGTIAWNYALKQKVNVLSCISATRLRYEKIKPESKINLIYGSNDTYKPDKVWFDRFGIEPTIISNEGHGLYSLPRHAKMTCYHLVKLLQKK